VTESEIRTHQNVLFQQKQGNRTQNKTTQQPDDGEGTMMVHSRRRIGFHGHQAMESTNN
jgi:hypothetical protein